jgi:uncharacterized membrane protein YesL
MIRLRVGAVFDVVYLALMTNTLLVAACLPLVLVLLTTDPGRSWPLLVLTAPLCAPALSAAFAVLARYSADGSTEVVTTFVRTWRTTARRALAVGGLATAVLLVLGVDIRAAWGRPVGALVIPLLAVAVVLVAATALLCLVVVAELPAAQLSGGGLRRAARASLYLAVRRWYLTLLSLVVLTVFEHLMASRPAFGLGLAATPLLYVIWANSRFTLRPALGPVRP